MTTTPAPHAQQVKVIEQSTGRVFLAWPVDARELVGHPASDYAYASAGATLGLPGAPVPAAEPVPATAAEQLAAKSYKELQALATRAGVPKAQKADALIAALLPHVAAGTVSLDVVPSVALPNPQFPGAEPA